MHICVGKLTTIGSDNGLSPGRCQAIKWTNAGMLLIGLLGTNLHEMLIEMQTFSLKEICLKMSSATWRPFCLGFNVVVIAWINCTVRWNSFGSIHCCHRKNTVRSMPYLLCDLLLCLRISGEPETAGWYNMLCAELTTLPVRLCVGLPGVHHGMGREVGTWRNEAMLWKNAVHCRGRCDSSVCSSHSLLIFPRSSCLSPWQTVRCFVLRCRIS